ncbi:patched domain-containing protein 3-like isoform X1 [Clytia hemisphaerica]
MLWNYDCNIVKQLNQSQILAKVNDDTALQTLTGKINLDLLLGSIVRSNGDITGASATKMTYFLKNQEVYVESQGKNVDQKGEDWETEFSDVFIKQKVTGGFDKVYIFSFVSQQDESGGQISDDLKFLFVGYVLIIAYLGIMLGSFSRLDQKVWLALCGVLNIGLAIGIAYGLSSAFQLFSTPVHSVLPFLLLGIGVDDVFVIIQNWDNIGGPKNRDRSIAENVSLALRTAGVSILVTSITDVCAFLIGATTILPALRSFCIFAGIGVLAVFILTCTFYVAWLALDSRRQRDHRDACCCCASLPTDWQPLECSKRMYLQEFMRGTYSKAILSTPGRIVLMLVWAGLLAGGAYGLSQLKQDFDPEWFLPEDSNARIYSSVDDKYFSNDGIQAYAYIEDVDYFADQDKLVSMYNTLENNQYTVKGETQSWYQTYIAWMAANHAADLTNGKPSTKDIFYNRLDEFTKTQVGKVFEKEIKGNITEQKIEASRIKYKHIKLEGASVEVKAMDSVQDELAKITFTNDFSPFGYTRFYVGWETNKVISEELIRNLLLAGVIVFLVTLFLIANVWVSLLVLTCVVFTLINIAGYMHFWGLTVDTVTTIQLILAIGLSVDYSAHIGHGFMAAREGNRVQRAAHALEEIGPAVVHGGFSTFLAFVCLGASQSYVFSTFFKLFFLVVVFGMFHGVVYLPIVLSLVGPEPYASSEPSTPSASTTSAGKPPLPNNGVEMTDDKEPETKTAGVDNASFVEATLAS